MLRVTLITIAGCTAHTELARRLQDEIREDQLRARRRNVWHDIGNAFGTGWDAIEKGTGDTVDWFENDVPDAFEDLNRAIEKWDGTIEGTEWLVKAIQGDPAAWDEFVDGLDAAWTWTKGAADAAGTEIEVFFIAYGCLMEDVVGKDCVSCVRKACNAMLDRQLDDTNNLQNMEKSVEVMLTNLESYGESYFESCASLMESCPSEQDCEALNNLPEESKKLEAVAQQLDTCLVCYSCLPYGSSEDSCSDALAQVLPPNCAGCSPTDQMLVNTFHSCSSMSKVSTYLDNLGMAYKEGTANHNSIDEICDWCQDCSKYEEELKEICSGWEKIKTEWDFQSPAIPSVLILED